MASSTGKAGTCTVNAVAVKISDWEFTAEADTPDSTDSGSAAGYKTHTVGRKSGTFVLRGFVDLAAPQTTTLAAGTVLSTVNLTYDGTTKYIIGSASVKSVKSGVKVEGSETSGWEAQCIVNGSWTEPA